MENSMLFVRVAQILKRIFYTQYDKRNIRKANRKEPISNLISRKFNILTKNQKRAPLSECSYLYFITSKIR